MKQFHDFIKSALSFFWKTNLEFLIPVALCLMIPSLSRAQTTLDPEWLNIEDGLSQGYVRTVIQDSDGFLWIGTKNGLNRFDGEHYKVFTHDPSDPYSISSDFIFALHEFGEFILVGTESSGLNLFHKKTHRFYRISPQGTDPQNPDLKQVSYIQEDKMGQIWLSTNAPYFLCRLRFPVNFQKDFPQQKSLLDNIEIQQIPNIGIPSSERFIIEDDHILTLNNNGQIWKVNIQNGEANLFQLSPVSEKEHLVALHRRSNGDLIIMPQFNTDRELNLLKSGEWHKIHTDFDINGFIYLEEKEQFWLVIRQGFYVYEEKFLDEKFLTQKDASYFFPQKSGITFDLEVDNGGNIWAGSTGHGVMKFSTRKTKVKHYFEGSSIYAKPFVSKKGDVLITSSVGEHLFIHGHQSKLYQTLFRDFSKKLSSTSYINRGTAEVIPEQFDFSQIIQDKNENLWEVGASYISQIKKDGQRELKQNIPVRNIPVFYDPAINSICFLAGAKGFFKYNIDNNNLSNYRFENILKSSFLGYSIAKTANGHYWLGTNRGLIHAIPSNGDYIFELFEKEETGVDGLLNNEVASLLLDPNDGNVLWIGTKGGGLHRLNTKDMTWNHVNSKNGLPNDVIYGVLNDEHGNLWMSSNKGIIRYTPSSGAIKNFTAADGLQSDEFNTHAYARGSDGTLYFGGINGLNIFHPDDLQDNPVTPLVLLTNLEVNNEYITVGDSTGILEEAIHYTSEITLSYTQNNISLEFAALEFTTPSKNRFRYYLEGAEKEWAHEDTENIAPYLNLSPGSYTFKIKGANGDGVWSDEVTSLKINILPPWYCTTLAYLIYLVLLGLSIWRFLKFRETRFRLKYNMEMERQKTERLEELDNMKSRFFTNISHEFRTPLTIISGMADQIVEQPDQWAKRGGSMIKRNTIGLLRLVNQILDLRKMESGALKLDMIQGNIIPYLQYILESFQSHAENRNIQLHFYAAQPSFLMDYDPDKIQKILSNLLSNAIRYSNEGAEVFLNVASQQDNGSEVLEIRVKDTGIGIPADKLPHIFDRFYQIDDSSTRRGEGSGIGLTFTRELIKALDGQIEVESEAGKGSVFTVLLPVSREATMPKAKETYQSSTIGEFIPLLKTEGPVEVKQQIDSGEQANLLIVEDNPDIVRYLISCLEGHYQIEVALDGQEGIEKAIEQVPDIIISDVMMPRKNGFELCALLKEDVRTSHIPIILLTAKADVDSRIQGLERGADVYLAKPFNKEELFVRLRKLVELRQRLQQRYSDLEVQHPSEDIVLQKEDEFIIQLRNLIHEHLDEEEYGITEICRDVAMSRAQLHRKIKALTGRSTSHFIRITRLIKAKELLLESNLTISEIAYEVGFKTPKYFSRVFSEEYGQSPKNFSRN